MSACNLAGVGLGTSGSSFDEGGRWMRARANPPRGRLRVRLARGLCAGEAAKHTARSRAHNASSPPSEKDA